MISKTLFFAFVCITLGKCDSLTETAGKDILQYLNSNSEQIYLYKSIKSLDIVNKEQDKYDVKTSIDVDCLQDADSPCLTKSFSCEGELQYMEKSGNFEIISLFCNPEIVENLKSEDEIIDTSTPRVEEEEQKEEFWRSLPPEIFESDPADPTDPTDPIQPEATPVPPRPGTYCTGCFENVDVNAAGVVDLVRTGLKHLETERDHLQSALEVVSVQRQIVAGVHYVIIIKVAPTTCPKTTFVISETSCTVDDNSPIEYCKIDYLQQSWISKASNIISNNCTNSQTFFVRDEDETTNVIDDVDKGKKFSNAPEEMSPERLKEMEMQIIADTFDSVFPVAAASAIDENNEVPMMVNLPPNASSSEESDETSSSEEEDRNQVERVRRSLKQSDTDTSDETSESVEEKMERRHKRKADNNGCDDDSSSSSSSSSSSDDDDDNNNVKNCNNGKSTKKPESNKGNGDDSSSSSSSSSSSDDDDNNNNGKMRRGMYKRDVGLSLNSEKALARNLAEFALAEANENIEDGAARIVLDVVITRKTRLEGFAYDLKIHTSLADCKLPKIDYSTANLLKYHIAKAYNNCFGHTKDDTLKTFYAQVHVNEEFTSPRLIKINSSARQKRQTLGGITDTSVSDPEIVDLAHQSVVLLDRNSGHDNKLKVVEITSASKQVVSGMLYRMSVKISLSDCTKSDSKLSRDCNQLEGSQVEKCDIEVWDRPWRTQAKETTFNCENREQKKFRSRRDLSGSHIHKRDVLVGAPTPANVNDPEIVELAHSSTMLLDGTSEHDNKYKMLKIASASKQVVAGVLYTLEVTISLSDCAKTDAKLARDCNQLTEGKEETCRIKIWDRPWLANGRETTFNCGDKQEQKFTSKRRRRSVGRIYGRDDFDVQLNAFRDFKDKYNKVYSSKKEQIRRFKIFRKNLAKVHEFNQNEKGTAVYGITKFSDLTYDEFRKNHMGLRTDLVYENEINFPQAEIPDIELPDEFDWRDKGAVTEVKNQGSCGSCWAFSTTGNVEGQYAIKHDKLLSFSEQELVDCDKSDEGCGGGLMENAYRAIEEIGGLELEKDYPYDAENEKCQYNQTLFRAQVTGAVNISQNEDDMAKWLVANGPIAIAINANAMQFYVGGVSHPWKFLCNPTSLDHGVLIVGYGVHTYPTFKKTLPYWIVKNSWGKSWGQQGYYLVYRGDGTCGVNQTPSSAIVA